MNGLRDHAALRLGCVVLLLGCGGYASGTRSARPLTEDDYPGALVDSRSLPPALFHRQRIEARFGSETLSFAAVLQIDSGVLSLLALTPYGTRAFLLEQRGHRVHFTNYVDRTLPFPPRFILVDVHRTFFTGLGGAPRPDGEHVGVLGAEEIHEVWRGGRLLERTYARRDARPAGRIRIRYTGGMRNDVPPPTIQLDNGWFGYQLTIHTLDED